jgi:5-methylcytosine-specific restriction enzyme B
MSYNKQLKKFLVQAKTDNLKTKHFDKKYNEMDVKVSFGQGNSARIPWISFLKKPNTTSNGIYPVYLYYKEYDLLILAFGISETTIPVLKWNINEAQKISDYFHENYSDKPDRYGSSYIFKVYNTNDMPSPEYIDNDLNSILNIYNNNIGVNVLLGHNIKQSIFKFNIQNAQYDIGESGLVYSIELITRFIASLLTKPFVILTGLSGSGKTKLAQAFVQWICHDESQYRIIPVGADWTNREPLLGYPNALKPEEYVKADSGVLDLIIQANNQPELPHFLILDEMNLSHVERYFADFLSVMESKEEIPLYVYGTEKNVPVQDKVPEKLKIPSNLFIIGTVNIDETTNMFSPKVLDRANTIEFRVTQDEMKNFLINIRDINMDALTGKGAGMAKSFLEMATNKEFATTVRAEINAALVQFFGELKKTGAEFGYRSATEILRLINQLSVLDNTLTINQKIDIAIIQKLLPKLHGSRRKLVPVLETLGSFCVNDNLKVIKDVFGKEDFDFDNHSDVIYRLSLEKIARMHKGAIDNGFASFAEA